MTERDGAEFDSAIAIIGLGGCFPGSEDVSAFWRNICGGHVAIKEVPHDRWDPKLYWSEDKSFPDRTYSRIGGFIDSVRFDRKRFRIPPRTLESVDDIQKLALTAVADALEDANLEVFPDRGEEGRAFDRDRTATILGNSMGGEFEDLTSLRVWYPSAVKALEDNGVLDFLSPEEKKVVLDDIEARFKANLPKVTEDSMPGELSNCITGRIANAFDLRGPNYTTDAACAASLAAVNTAVQGLRLGQYDMAIAGGVDRSMDPPTYAKFSKIGALSAEHSAPFDARANGFVMGEGCGILILKRLQDAQRDGDQIYAVIRGIGAASDGKGKGMTAPNPRGQRMAIERAYQSTDIPLKTVGLFEAHGTSTVVGDATEVQVLSDLLEESGVSPAETPIGSVKSMIGHLKSAAGAAALIKATLALHHKTLPPSANFKSAPKDSPLHKGYLKVIQNPLPWESDSTPRRAGVSAFGFGGTNFHVILEEAGAIDPSALKASASSTNTLTASSSSVGYVAKATSMASKGTTMNRDKLLAEITQLFAETTGYDLEDLDPNYELENDLGIDTVKQAEIFGVLREQYSMDADEDFKLSEVQTLSKIVDYVAGQSSSMSQPETTEVAEADVEAGGNLPSPAVFVFGGESKEDVVAQAQGILDPADSFSADLVAMREEARTAPVRLAFAAANLEDAQTKASDAGRRREKVLVAQGIFLNQSPVVGSDHKVAFLFPGQGSQYVNMFRDLADTYPAVKATFTEADEILEPLIGEKITDIVWPSDIDPASPEAAERLKQTEICQPAMLAADVAMMRLLQAHGIRPDFVAGHSLGEYAACVAAGVMTFADALYAVSARGREMAGVKVADNGKMATVAADAERVAEILKEIDGYVIAANKNCKSQTVIAGESDAVDRAVEKFGELKVDARHIPVSHAFHSAIVAPAAKPLGRVLGALDLRVPTTPILSNVHADFYPTTKARIVELLSDQLESPVEFIAQVERLYEEGARTFVEVGPRRAITGFVRNILSGKPHRAIATNHHKKTGIEGLTEALAALASDGVEVDFDGTSDIPVLRSSDPIAAEKAAAAQESTLVVSGMAVGLPTENPTGELSDDLFARILGGENFIKPIEPEARKEIAEKNVLRLNKTTGEFEKLQDLSDVIQLAGRISDVDLVNDYGLDVSFDDALDTTSRLAIAVGIDALRDAGLPLIRKYRTTSTGKQLPDRWALPESVGKRTGVIFASAFPGLDRTIDDVSRQVAASYAARTAVDLKKLVENLCSQITDVKDAALLRDTFGAKVEELENEADLYRFNRKFLFRILAMGHAQLAQTIGAQGPNTAVNAACASGAQAMAIASDWIHLGRCDRVVVVTADDVTSPTSLPWIGAGFLATGAATVESEVDEAAVPFGAKRNGMILGSGASAFVIERDELVNQRGMNPIGEVLASQFSNSAFHGTRLDGVFICDEMEQLVQQVETKTGYDRETLAQKSFFMSHETYTPARGGSSQAEVDAIRHVFGDYTSDFLIANTKGYTGHPMGATIEDVVALKGLQRSTLPAVANLREVDPAFADLNFSDGGTIDREIGIRFAAGFGSQIAIVAYRQRATTEARLFCDDTYHRWLDSISGKENAGLEVISRTLRVSEKEGERVTELGIPSLELTQESIEVAKGIDVPVLEEAPKVEPIQETIVAPVAAKPASGDLFTEIRALFAEQTGYEIDDLEPDYQLEADLGIDTVKQAEIFSILRERYSMPTDEDFKLSEVQTLRAVVQYCSGFVSQEVPTVEPKEESIQVEASPAGVAALGRDELFNEIIQLFAEQTGYELEDLEPDYQLEADLGIDTVKQAEIFSLLRTNYGMSQDESFKLSDVQTLNAVVDYVLTQMGGLVQPSVVEEPVVAPTAEATLSTTAPSTGGLIDELVALFAEQTGYEPEDLELTYELEADLGIDTVKQAEIFSIIRERYQLAEDESFRLADVPTITAIADYIGRFQGEEPIAASPVVSSPLTHEALVNQIQALFAEQTGYEVEDLDPAYGLEEDLGIDTVKQAEILAIIRERHGLPQSEDFKLSEVQTLNALAEYVLVNASTLRQDSVQATAAVEVKEAVADLTASDLLPVEPWKENHVGAENRFQVQEVRAIRAPEKGKNKRTLDGRSIIVAGGDEDLRRLFMEEFTNRNAKVVELCHTVSVEDLEACMKKATGGEPHDLVYLLDSKGASKSEKLPSRIKRIFELSRAFGRVRQDMNGAGLLLVGQSSGVFGFFDDALAGTALGALAGIAKTLAKEWEGSHCRAFDLDASGSDLATSVSVAVDEWLSDGPVELAWRKGERFTLARVDHVEEPTWVQKPNDVVVATGGTRGVTFEILRHMASKAPLKMALVARTAGIESAESPIFGKSAAERKEIARDFLEKKTEKVTPIAIKNWIAKQERKLEVAANVDELRSLGCEVELYQCDVGDQEELVRVSESIQKRFGEVDLLIHGAGLEESKFLVDKDLQAFRRVFEPKASAALTLYFGLEPKRMVTMGSVAGRFGNAGQVDYAAANELMGAFSRRSGRGILNINWTAWGDIGMATRGSVKQVLEGSGVDLLPAAIGASLGAMLAGSELRGDIVVAGALGQFSGNELENPEVYDGKEPLPWLFESSKETPTGVQYFRTLDAAKDAGLDHHRLEGVPLLPGVLGVELMTVAAQHYAGEEIAELRDVRFEGPVKLYKEKPLTISVDVRSREAGVMEMVLASYFEKPNGTLIRREHFFAQAHTGTRREPQRRELQRLEMPRDPQISKEAVYQRYFHGPAFQVLEKITELGEDGIEVIPTVERPDWVGSHSHDEFITAPLLREVGFQGAGLWEMAELGRMALPAGIERLVLTSEAIPIGNIKVHARRRGCSGSGSSFDIWVCDSEGRSYDVMRGYKTQMFRTLDKEERFEPTRRLTESPRWIMIDLNEVKEKLDKDAEATIKRYLSEKEMARFKGLKTDKRRKDWFAGRVAAKRLIREDRFASEGAIIPYGAITILPDSLGKPRVSVVGEGSEPLLISISHSAGVAAAFQSLQKEWVPGIDVELIEERDPSFERGYFTENELALVEKEDNRHALLTAIWAVKEAMLKALGIGARVDFRDLDVLREKNQWQVVTKGEALKRAMDIGAGCPEVEVDIEETRVVARVLLPVNPNQEGVSKFTDIRENSQQENAQ